MRRARLAALGIGAALLSVCAEHAPVSPLRGSGASRVKVGDVLLVDIDDHSARQLPQSAATPFIDAGYVAGEYKIRMEPEYQNGAGADYFAGPSSLFANVHVAVDSRLMGGVESRRLGVGRRARARGELAALAPKKQDRKPTPADPRDRKIAELERQLALMTGRGRAGRILGRGPKNFGGAARPAGDERSVMIALVEARPARVGIAPLCDALGLARATLQDLFAIVLEQDGHLSVIR